jgi:threonylcarbamoyladenosine tRNA methylthiotransferase MtaB
VSSFYVENFGCRATQADGAAIEQQFRERGLDRAKAPTDADFVVLNTCAVTAAAELDARAAIRRIRRQNPGCKIVMTGCYAQRAPAEVAALPGVSHVIGNSHKHTLARITLRETLQTNISQNREFIPVSDLERSGASSAQNEANWPISTPAAQRRNMNSPARECGKQRSEGSRVRFSGRHTSDFIDPTAAEIFVSDIFAHTELLAAPVLDSANERTRPNLKIQDGCNNRCSFCIIPSLRGRSRSLPVKDVLREVNQLVDGGYRELVLSGINLGRWGRDLNVERRAPSPIWSSEARQSTNSFEGLIRTILTHTSIEKLRISSVEPMDWTDSLIQLVAESPRIAKHAHVPMQSGSDALLRRMHRKYRPWHYREKIEKIRAAIPDAAIGADVMVGFPGETDAEFEETRSMIERLPFTYMHVFTFSARPGTPAASMPNQVPVHIARERNRILRDLAAEKKLAFMRSFIGLELQAITLNVTGEDENGAWTEALTDNYLKIRIQGTLQANQWLTARVIGVENGELFGIAAEQKFEREHGVELPPVPPRSGGRIQPEA